VLYARHHAGGVRMSTFSLHVQDVTRAERVEQVESFVGHDASGSFGIMANHHRMMTVLVFGLARFRLPESPWQYLALPGGVLYVVDNVVLVYTRRYLLDSDYDRVSRALDEQLAAEERNLGTLKDSLRQLEEELFRRLWQLGRREIRG
jgi:F-type H+-transporting ATPase subunit epsilon